MKRAARNMVSTKPLATALHNGHYYHAARSFSPLNHCYSTSSLYSGWTPKMWEVGKIFEAAIGEAVERNQRFYIASDADGTLIHSKKPIHKAIIHTHQEFNIEANWDENTSLEKIAGPQDKMFQQMFSGTQICPKAARVKFEQKLDTYYSQETTLMPDVEKFLQVVSILQKHEILGISVVSFMNHDPLNLAAENLGIKRIATVVEGLQNQGKDKDRPLIFTERVYPKMREQGFGEPLKVICIGDGRYTDRIMAENVPGNKGVYIAYNNKKEDGKLKEEKVYPWIPDWKNGAKMLASASLEVIERNGVEKLGRERCERIKRDLMDSAKITPEELQEAKQWRQKVLERGTGIGCTL